MRSGRGWLQRFLVGAVGLAALAATGMAIAAVEAQANAASITGIARVDDVPGLSITRTTRIEEIGHKLDPFYAALDAAAHDKGIARIAYYGDSHVASDDYTAPLRTLLQQRFGAAGLGFVLPAKAERWYRRVGLSMAPAQGFRAERVRERTPQTLPLGLYGLALHSDASSVATTRISTSSAQAAFGASRVQLYYGLREGGGSMEVRFDEREARVVSTDGAAGEYKRLDFKGTDGPHSLEVATRGDGPVTLLGAVFERDRPGVVLDMLGIPGARARSQLQWNRPLRRKMLEERKPQLVVLAYGTNEAGDDDSMASYEVALRGVVTHLRADSPNAACLLVGPTDRPIRNGRTITERPRVREISQVPRRVARRRGGGGFGTQQFMGGPGSMRRWVQSRPALGAPDHVHLTAAGYRALGHELFAAIEHGYLDYARRLGGKPR
jgi:lysophospholipase L1-like esterase